MTATKPALHDFEGRTVQRATVKITNAGDGLSEALSLDPEEIELEEYRSFVLTGKCSRVSIETDKNGVTSRVHTIKTTDIAKVDDAVAQRIIQANAQAIEQRKRELDGQLALDDEEAAEAREQLDDTGTPGEVADAAAERIKNGE